MANYKRRRPRTQLTHSPWIGREIRDPSSPRYYNWTGCYPRWWDIVFHTRPWRRRERAMLRAVLLGQLDADEAPWPVPHKPHRYYW